jgi:hypothetical protein
MTIVDIDAAAAGVTELVINVVGLPPQSAWGVTEKVVPIDESAQIRRDVDGVLHDRSLAQFRKYQVSLSAEGMNAPALVGIWPGQEIVIDCITEFFFLTASGIPEREVVEGSERVLGDYTAVRYRLTCLVTSWDQEIDELEATTTWSLEAAEI